MATASDKCQVFLAGPRRTCNEGNTKTISIRSDDGQTFRVKVCPLHLSVHNDKAARNRVATRSS